MTKKRSTPSKPRKGLAEPEAAYKHREGEGLTEAEWKAWEKQHKAWEERNKDALVASLREAEAQIARGEYYTAEEVRARLEARAKRRRAAKAK